MKTKLFDWLLNQSPAFVVMAIVSYFLFQKVSDLESKMDHCQGQQIELLKTTVEDNTRAFEKFTEILENMK